MIKFLDSFFFAYLSLAILMVVGGSVFWIILQKLAKSEDSSIPSAVKIGIEYILGAFSLILAALISRLAGYPRIGIKILVILAVASLVILFLRKYNIKTGIKCSLRWCFSRLLLAALPGIFLCFIFSSQFAQPELERFTNPWLVTSRFKVYPSIDHHLQWLIADNIYKRKNLETNFNLDRRQLWSAGDRPIIWGFINAIFSRITDAHQLLDYFYRTILFSSFVWVGIFGILKVEFRRGNSKILIFTILPIMTSPFFMANFLYTWPKMIGLSFGLFGMLLFLHSLKDKGRGSKFFMVLSGIAFAIGTTCHTAIIFCLFASVIYYFVTQLLSKQSINFKLFSVRFFYLLIPFLIITQLHSQYLKAFTYQTNLLPRVQICRDGSYLYPTPPKSIIQACSEYLERVGVSGIIQDRVASLERALFYGIPQFFELLFDFSATSYAKNLFQKLDGYFQSCLFVSNGIFFLPLLAFSIFLIFYNKDNELDDSFLNRVKSTSLLLVSLICISGFSSLLGETSEMAPHVMPYIVPVLIYIGSLMLVRSISYKLFICFSIFMVLIHSLVYAYRIPKEEILNPYIYITSFLLYVLSILVSIYFIEKRAKECPNS